MEEETYYRLEPVRHRRGQIVNASVGVCLICGEIATGMGGSGMDICRPCGEDILSGKFRIIRSMMNEDQD